MMSECLTDVCSSVQLFLSGSNSWVSLFHPQKMSSAWKEESDTDMNLFWITSVRSFISKHKLPMMLHPQWSSSDCWFHSAVCDHIHQSRSFCQEIKTQYKYDYINALLNEIRSADLPLWTQQDSLSRGDGGDPDRWSTFLQVNVPSWRSTE